MEFYEKDSAMDTDKLKEFVLMFGDIQTKMEKIYDIMGWHIGNDFNGINVDPRYRDNELSIHETSFTYETTTHYSGCGLEGYSRTISLAELAQPESYWKGKRDEKEREAEEFKKRSELEAIKLRKDIELKTLEELKAKYPNH
jgi:hypothetical protein